MASPITGTNSSGSTPEIAPNTKIADKSQALANKDTFLKLLVAQIKNQNPLNPQDGAQFLSQLATFSNLETNMDMRTELEAIHKILDGQATPAPEPKENK